MSNSVYIDDTETPGTLPCGATLPLSAALPMYAPARRAHARLAAIAEAVAAAGQADLPQHRRQHDRHPERLLAMVAALERPGGGDHGAAARHAAGEVADRLRGQAADAGRPVGVLRHAVGRAGDRKSTRLNSSH